MTQSLPVPLILHTTRDKLSQFLHEVSCRVSSLQAITAVSMHGTLGPQGGPQGDLSEMWRSPLSSCGEASIHSFTPWYIQQHSPG